VGNNRRRDLGSWFLAGNGGSQTELEFSLGRSEERLVDLRLVRVKRHVRGYRVGVTLEYDVFVGLNLKNATELNITLVCILHTGARSNKWKEAAAWSNDELLAALRTFSGST
jgi:hypothetical protein